jgi:hypothetical protein
MVKRIWTNDENNMKEGRRLILWYYISICPANVKTTKFSVHNIRSPDGRSKPGSLNTKQNDSAVCSIAALNNCSCSVIVRKLCRYLEWTKSNNVPNSSMLMYKSHDVLGDTLVGSHHTQWNYAAESFFRSYFCRSYSLHSRNSPSEAGEFF